MKTIFIIFPDGTEDEMTVDNAINAMYYKLGCINKSKYKNIKKVKKILSQSDTLIPLFDIFSKNIYVINAQNVYNRVTNFHYRLPTEKVINRIELTLKKIKDKRLTPYKEKLMKNVNFMNNFDYNALQKNYFRLFYQSQPSSSELTSCIKPSFIPFMTMKPYYTRSELINLGLNMNLTLESDLEAICSQVSSADIDSNTILKHQQYIKSDKAYVQLYSLLGSCYWNYYIRNECMKDPYVEKEIEHLYSIINGSPAFDKDYWVYRFVDNDNYLQHLNVGDIFNESSFISTTRNPFYDTKNNIFGFILIKIKIPKGVKGVGLCMESYSLFPEEEEILLNPAKLKLVSKDKEFKYYHPSVRASKRIKKLYVFEYVDKNTIQTNSYEPYDKEIIDVDWLKTTINGNDFASKVYHFYRSIPEYNNKRYFYTNIGDKRYMLTAFFLDDNPIYEKYFFLQKKDNKHKEEIYFTLQDDNGSLLLIIELRDIISVNYLHRFIGSVQLPFSDEELIKFLSLMARSFSIGKVLIHDEYITYDTIASQLLNDSKNVINDFNPDNHIVSLYSGDFRYYNKSLIDHIEGKEKRFKDIPGISYNLKNHHFTRFKNTDVEQLFEDIEKSELFNILRRLKTKQNLLDFYIYIHYNYFYLIPELNNLIIAYDKDIFTDMKSSPWINSYILLNTEQYLFERKIIPSIKTFKSNVFQDYLIKLSDEHKNFSFNKYRLGLL